MTKPFNIHDWQAKQRLLTEERSQEYMPNEIIKSLQVAVSNHSVNKILNNLAVIIDKTGKHDEADMIKKLASQIQDFEDEDEMHDDPGDIRIDHDYYTEQNELDEMSTTGKGASFNAGSGEGYMTPNAFKKKKK